MKSKEYKRMQIIMLISCLLMIWVFAMSMHTINKKNKMLDQSLELLENGQKDFDAVIKQLEKNNDSRKIDILVYDETTKHSFYITYDNIKKQKGNISIVLDKNQKMIADQYVYAVDKKSKTINTSVSYTEKTGTVLNIDASVEQLFYSKGYIILR